MAAPALRLGSLCSGYGGLDLAASEVFGAVPVWHAETDPGASAILARHWPGVPNLGDISAVDFRAVPPVDVLTAGFPCQDISSAGLRRGIAEGTRSGLWRHVARAVDALRPRFVAIENVRGLLSARADSDMEPCPWCLGDTDAKPALRALGAVLGDLAGIGFDAEWEGLPASAVGAAHPRFRVFVLARPADPEGEGREGARLPGRTPGTGGVAAHADGLGGERHGTGGQSEERHAAGAGGIAAHAEGVGEREPADEADPVAARREAREEPSCGGGEPAADTDSRGFARDAELPGGRQRIRQRVREDADRCGAAAAHPESIGRHPRGPEPARQQGGSDAAIGGGAAAADAEGERHGHAGAPGVGGLPATAVASGAAAAADADSGGFGAQQPDVRAGQPHVEWGDYAPAVERWAGVLGRPAPSPTDPQGRLSPRFVEWLMGLPIGHVTDTPGLARSAQLRALGNGVVPQQAVAALRLLLARTPAADLLGTERTTKGSAA